MLILKTMDSSREIAPLNYKPCRLTITSDNFLLIFDKPETGEIPRFKKPNVTLQINQVALKRTGPGLVEMQIVIGTNFFDKFMGQREIYVFKFRTDDELEEFTQVVEAL